MASFPEWLQEQLDERGWRQIDLVNRSGIYSSYITYILQGKHKPGPKFCRSIASALDLKEELVFIQAGHLSPKIYTEYNYEDWITSYSQLSISDQQELIEFARFKLFFKDPVNSN